MKNIILLSENFQFLMVKFSIYLNRSVFVMATSGQLGLISNPHIYVKKNPGMGSMISRTRKYKQHHSEVREGVLRLP